MGFKEVISLDADVTVALGGKDKKTNKPNPKSAEGYFLGSKKVASTKSKSGFAFIHILQTPKGNLGVWGKTDLDRKMLNVPAGTMVRITQTNMQETPNGPMYKFKVELDETNTVDVGDLNTSASDDDSGETEAGSYGDSGADMDYDGQGEEEHEAPPARVSASAEERKQRTQALFKNRKAN